MYEYKDEILSSRVGNLGASDANLIARVAQSGSVPRSAMERLAIAKGIIPPQEKFKTDAMLLGDEIEMAIYESLKTQDSRWESNKLLRSKKFSRANISLIAHIDFFLQDDEKKVLHIVECKATKESIDETRQTYANQLYVEYMLAKEYLKSIKGRWVLDFELCHYCTANHTEFDPANITMKKIKFNTSRFDIGYSMDIIDSYVSKLDCYYSDDIVESSMLPTNVQQQFELMTAILHEIKERETKVDEFKRKLYEFLVSHDIKAIKSDAFNITRVDPTESVSFDYKAFLDDYAKEHPTLQKRLVKTYQKRTQRKGFAKITIK